jgi:octaprenyl-diphosphate synthase
MPISEHAIGLMTKHPRARGHDPARAHLRRIATDALALFPASPMKQALEETVEFCICRSN